MSLGFRHAFSHAVVAGTTIWCLYNTHRTGLREWRWIYGAYAPLCLYAFLGIWRFGNPQFGEDVHKYYAYANKFVMAFTVPYFITELYLNYGYEFHYAMIHAAVPLIPVTLDLAKNEWEQELMDGILIINIISGFILSILENNYYGIAACLSYLITHFVFRLRELGDVPNKIIYNAGLSFFLFYSYKALKEAYIL